MTIDAKNIYYFYNINSIGGIETFFYYLAKKYFDKDLVIVYQHADTSQLRRLKRYVRCVKYIKGMTFTCEKAFFNFNLEIIDSVKASEYILVLHGDYKDMVLRGQIASPPRHSKITKVIGVSKIACDSYEELTGIKCELCYNPIAIDEPKKILNLISATRLSREKGKDRMIKLANILDSAGIPYIWLVFTNSKETINNPNIIFMPQRLDITGYIKNADALIQLSDNEGYCYSVIEALCLGTPVIVTKCPVFDELGLDETNSIKCNFDMAGLNGKDIYEKIINMKVNYKPKEDNWDKLFAEGKSTYEYDPKEMVEVIALRKFTDIEANTVRLMRDKFYCDVLRAEDLMEKGLVIKNS